MGNDISLRSVLSASALPQSEAKILLAFVLEKHYQLPRSALLSRDEMALNANALQEWRDLESRRRQGEPMAYLVGKRGFHAIELEVAPGVLIPRPETELLVDIALQEIQQLGNQAKVAKVLDLGTGSGAIALAVAHAAPQAIVTATDQSTEALDIAKRNATHLQLNERVQFAQGSWYEALENSVQFDVILSNPPYIAAGDTHLSHGDLRFEPSSALTDGANGLSCLEAIISGANRFLRAGGLIAVEHGFDQSADVVNLMKMANFDEIRIHQDLAGHCRVVSARKPNH